MSRYTLFISLLLIALMAFLPPADASADETRIIQLKHRTARDIIPLIHPLIGPDDALSGIDYRLIIRTSEKNFGEIDRILGQLDVEQRRLQITVEQAVAEDETFSSQSLSGHARVNDNARITLPARPPGDRGVVVEKDGIRYNAVERSTTARNANVQTVMTLDGQSAYIRVGQSVAYTAKIVDMSHDRATISQGSVAQRDVATGFVVIPHVHGDRVRIDLTPRLASLQNPATGLADFQELGTTVDVRLGEWIELGAILGERDKVGRATLNGVATGSGEHRTLRLKIE